MKEATGCERHISINSDQQQCRAFCSWWAGIIFSYLRPECGDEKKSDEALSKVGRVLKEQPFIAAFAYGFNETGANAKPISEVTDF
jgi:hypothetical protein